MSKEGVEFEFDEVEHSWVKETGWLVGVGQKGRGAEVEVGEERWGVLSPRRRRRGGRNGVEEDDGLRVLLGRSSGVLLLVSSTFSLATSSKAFEKLEARQLPIHSSSSPRFFLHHLASISFFPVATLSAMSFLDPVLGTNHDPLRTTSEPTSSSSRPLFEAARPLGLIFIHPLSHPQPLTPTSELNPALPIQLGWRSQRLAMSRGEEEEEDASWRRSRSWVWETLGLSRRERRAKRKGRVSPWEDRWILLRRLEQRGGKKRKLDVFALLSIFSISSVPNRYIDFREYRIL